MRFHRSSIIFCSLFFCAYETSASSTKLRGGRLSRERNHDEVGTSSRENQYGSSPSALLRKNDDKNIKTLQVANENANNERKLSSSIASFSNSLSLSNSLSASIDSIDDGSAAVELQTKQAAEAAAQLQIQQESRLQQLQEASLNMEQTVLDFETRSLDLALQTQNANLLSDVERIENDIAALRADTETLLAAASSQLLVASASDGGISDSLDNSLSLSVSGDSASSD